MTEQITDVPYVAEAMRDGLPLHRSHWPECGDDEQREDEIERKQAERLLEMSEFSIENRRH